MASVLSGLSDHLTAEKAQGRELVFVRFFLSDAQNQAPALREAMRTGNAGTGLPLWDTAQPFARRGGICGGPYSIVEQPPLDGSRIAALVWTSAQADRYLFHSLRLTEEEAAGKSSYEQSRLLFDKYLGIIRPLGLDLKTHCIRTWIYVRDIDSNYAGLVKARNDVFTEEGLSHDTHYIASTGIGGANEVRSAAFERGVRVKDHIFISGTASIDHKGRILHEGDVLAQADRLLENIRALLTEGGLAGQASVPYFIIYLRDIADYAKVDAYMQTRFPDTPRIILEARVCRPGWLIEMECEASGCLSAVR